MSIASSAPATDYNSATSTQDTKNQDALLFPGLVVTKAKETVSPEAQNGAAAPEQENPSLVLDIDGDGVLSKFEIDTWREIAQGDIQRLGQGDVTAEHQDLIATFEGFLVELNKEFPEIDGNDILLREFDADGEGTLSAAEIAQSKTKLQTTINTLVNSGADKSLYVHAQQLMAALNALEAAQSVEGEELAPADAPVEGEDISLTEGETVPVEQLEPMVAAEPVDPVPAVEADAGTNGLPPAAVLDLDGDGELSEFEVSAWQEVVETDIANFQPDNATPEQQATIERFKEFLGYLAQHEPTLSKNDLLLRQFDFDDSADLSVAEVEKAQKAMNHNIGYLNDTGADRTLIVHAEQVLAELDALHASLTQQVAA